MTSPRLDRLIGLTLVLVTGCVIAREWGAADWVNIPCYLLLVVAIAAPLMRAAQRLLGQSRSRVLGLQLSVRCHCVVVTWLAAVVLAMVLGAALAGGRKLHVHHYMWAGVLAP